MTKLHRCILFLTLAASTLLPAAAPADPLPMPPPCTVEARQKAGEVCEECSSKSGEVAACGKKYKADGYSLRCTATCGKKPCPAVWCKSKVGGTRD